MFLTKQPLEFFTIKASLVKMGVMLNKNTTKQEAHVMKCSRKQVNCKAPGRLTLRFESQKLTAFGGVIVLKELVGQLKLMDRLRRILREPQRGTTDRPQELFLQLVFHLLLGFRASQDLVCYQEGPLMQRALGLG